MDRGRLFAIFEALDTCLESPCELDIRGGAAVLALGLDGRATLDVDVLPSSRFEADLTEAFGRLRERWRSDPVVADNLRYVLQDL
ncbi:MAG: hypothetical protein V1750_04835 [Acidobacteriota bacterium]